MHELSITEHLLEDCLREAKQQNASRIRVIRLCIGELRGSSRTASRSTWTCWPKGYRRGAQGSNPRPFPSKSIAWTAAGTRDHPHHLECPHCGSLRLKLLSGKEFYIKSLEVDINGDQSTSPGNGLE